MRKEKAAEELQLHSDQGFQYTSHAYFSLTKEYGMIPHVKSGQLLREPAPLGTMPWLRISFPFSSRNVLTATSFSLSSQARSLIDDFIWFYNHERIQLKTKLTPLQKRRQLA